MKKRFSIRYKILSVISLLIAACVILYLTIAIKIFKSDKIKLVYELNRTQVTNSSAKLEANLNAILEKIALQTQMLYTNNLTQSDMKLFFEKDSRIAHLSVSLPGQNNFTFSNSKYLELYGLPEHYFTKTLPSLIAPLNPLETSSAFVSWNATKDEAPPLLGISQSILIETSTGKPISRHQVTAYLPIDKIFTGENIGGISNLILFNNQGSIILKQTSNEQKHLDASVFSEFVKKSMKSPTNVLVSTIDNENGSLLVATSKIMSNQFVLLSYVPEATAFQAVHHLVKRSLIFSLIIFTSAFIAAVWFSRSLTKPLEKLTEGMKTVRQGQLETIVTIDSRDEISELANTFNSMTSQIRESQYQLQIINRDLEVKVQERTKELEIQNQAVKEAQEALLNSTRLAAAGEIAGQAAHEVLNPLTGIMNRIENVKNRIKNQISENVSLLGEISLSWKQDYSKGGIETLQTSWKQKSNINSEITLLEEDIENFQNISTNLSEEMLQLQKDMSFLNNEGQRINRIVNSMRSLSYVSAERNPHKINEAVKEATNVMMDLLNKHKIDLDFKFCFENPIVEIDKDEFIQVMTNLLRNAIQSINSDPDKKVGKIVIQSSLEGNEALLRISDNGPGISKQHQAMLFKSQFTTKNKNEGTGVGLNISRRFIRALGGDLRFVSSVPYSKTEFLVTLPRFKEQTDKVAS